MRGGLIVQDCFGEERERRDRGRGRGEREGWREGWRGGRGERGEREEWREAERDGRRDLIERERERERVKGLTERMVGGGERKRKREEFEEVVQRERKKDDHDVTMEEQQHSSLTSQLDLNSSSDRLTSSDIFYETTEREKDNILYMSFDDSFLDSTKEEETIPSSQNEHLFPSPSPSARRTPSPSSLFPSLPSSLPSPYPSPIPISQALQIWKDAKDFVTRSLEFGHSQRPLPFLTFADLLYKRFELGKIVERVERERGEREREERGRRRRFWVGRREWGEKEERRVEREMGRETGEKREREEEESVTILQQAHRSCLTSLEIFFHQIVRREKDKREREMEESAEREILNAKRRPLIENALCLFGMICLNLADSSSGGEEEKTKKHGKEKEKENISEEKKMEEVGIREEKPLRGIIITGTKTNSQLHYAIQAANAFNSAIRVRFSPISLSTCIPPSLPTSPPLSPYLPPLSLSITPLSTPPQGSLLHPSSYNSSLSLSEQSVKYLLGVEIGEGSFYLQSIPEFCLEEEEKKGEGESEREKEVGEEERKRREEKEREKERDHIEMSELLNNLAGSLMTIARLIGFLFFFLILFIYFIIFFHFISFLLLLEKIPFILLLNYLFRRKNGGYNLILEKAKDCLDVSSEYEVKPPVFFIFHFFL